MSPFVSEPTTAGSGVFGVEMSVIYEIIGPTGTRAVINDPTDTDHVGFLMEPPSGLEGAGIRENAGLLPEADGGVHGAFYRDRMSFTLTGIIDASDDGPNAAAQDRLLRATNALRGDSVLRWRPSTIPEGVELAFRVQQPTRITGRRPKSFLIAGVAEDPRVYSRTLRRVSIDRPYTTYGLALNDGSADSWPVLFMRGPVTNPQFRDDSLAAPGPGVYFNATLAANEHLVIDTNPRRRRIRRGTATLGSVANAITNPSPQINLAGWVQTSGFLTAGGTLTRDTTIAGPVPGRAVARFDTTTAGQGIGHAIASPPASTNYTVSVYLRGYWGGETVNLYIYDFTTGQVALAQLTLPQAWTRYTVSGVLPAAPNAPQLLLATRGAANQIFYFDRAMGTPAAAPRQDYADGQTPGFDWENTPYASRTMFSSLLDASLAKANGTLNFPASRWWPVPPRAAPGATLVFTSDTFGEGALGWAEWRNAWG